MLKQQIFKESKKFFKSEDSALQSLLKKKPNIRQEDLKAKHTENNFQWAYNPTFRRLKTECNEVEAKGAAKLELKTFEGNLKAAHTELEYVFTKVRQ